MSAAGGSCPTSRKEGGSSHIPFASLLERRKRSYGTAVGSKSGSPEAKRNKSNFYLVLQSESEPPTDEDTESEHSIQGKETDFPKDTSDTSTHSDCWSDSSAGAQIEYELATTSEHPTLKSDDFSSGTDEDFVRTATMIAAVIDDDLGLFADTSDSESEPVFDPELPRRDYWTCVQCKNKNNTPLFRYCEKCFRLRKDFLPPRPRHRRSKKKAGKSPPPSEDLNIPVDNKLVKSSSELTTDSGYQCSEPPSPQPSTSKDPSEVSNGSELCIICMWRPRNGIFVHPKIGHVCCCYKCALKVWKGQRRCPMCRGQIKNVLQVFNY